MFLVHNTQFAFILANNYALIVSRCKKMWLTKGEGSQRPRNEEWRTKLMVSETQKRYTHRWSKELHKLLHTYGNTWTWACLWYMGALDCAVIYLVHKQQKVIQSWITSIPSQKYMKLHCDTFNVLIVEALKIVLGWQALSLGKYLPDILNNCTAFIYTVSSTSGLMPIYISTTTGSPSGGFSPLLRWCGS